MSTDEGGDMLHHVSLGVTDLARAGAFYDALLEPLGFGRVWFDSSAIGYGERGGEDRLALKLRADVRAPGPGFHVAFAAPSRAATKASYFAALGHGGRDSGAPGLRPHYGANYYAAFLVDPDGHPIEIVFDDAAG